MNPFRYIPSEAVVSAARQTIGKIESSPELSAAFSEGKMIGVLIVKDMEGNVGFLSGFSGNVGGRSHIEGFVPPIFDLLEDGGYYKSHEAEISAVGQEIAALLEGDGLAAVTEEIRRCENQARIEIGAMKLAMAESRKRRENIRHEMDATAGMDLPEALIRQSQHEKASLRRLKKQWEERIAVLSAEQRRITGKVDELRLKRKRMSDELQQWIFSQYVVHNARGDKSTIGDIFASRGLVPPGGTGECAAPKLLEYAYRNHLRPLDMGEFWYGKSPRTAVRVHGHFYPSCTSKCGPLLGYMMQGLDMQENQAEGHDRQAVEGSPEILHVDSETIVAVKPSGMPSVPGLDGRESLQEWLSDETGGEVLAVHRLDMDTSGVMVFARSVASQASLRSQFENRTVRKKYIARLCPPDSGPSQQDSGTFTPTRTSWKASPVDVLSEGTISLPLSPDYDERPRQKVDMTDGKEAVTMYHVLKEYPDGTSEVEFRPLTGRTHQLRVHSAHPLGLGRPIVGDLLYGGFSTASGGFTPTRLHLHALSLAFTHPVSGEELTFSSLKLSFLV